MGKLAFAHPGKIGDALYCLPVMRHLCEQYCMQCDFYTSSYCAPLKRLFEYQSYVDQFVVAPDYVLERMDMGCQPWHVPVPDVYAQTYQLGFQSIPDGMLHQWIARSAGVDVPLAIQYDYPITPAPKYPYICIAPRGHSTFVDLFDAIADATHSIIIGGIGDYTWHGMDMTGTDMLNTLSILSHATAFVGLMSSQLVLANGFDIPRIVPHDGIHWDMRHALSYHRNIYLCNPDSKTVLRIVKGGAW